MGRKKSKQTAKKWRRGWDSNPRAGYPTRRFRGAPVTTTSVPLRVVRRRTCQGKSASTYCSRRRRRVNTSLYQADELCPRCGHLAKIHGLDGPAVVLLLETECPLPAFGAHPFVSDLWHILRGPIAGRHCLRRRRLDHARAQVELLI